MNNEINKELLKALEDANDYLKGLRNVSPELMAQIANAIAKAKESV